MKPVAPASRDIIRRIIGREEGLIIKLVKWKPAWQFSAPSGNDRSATGASLATSAKRCCTLANDAVSAAAPMP